MINKRYIAIAKIDDEGNNTYLTGRNTNGELIHDFTKNINFAYVFEDEQKAWDLWNGLPNYCKVKKFTEVMTKVIK